MSFRTQWGRKMCTCSSLLTPLWAIALFHPHPKQPMGKTEVLFLRGWPSTSHLAPFAPTVQGDHLPDEQHAAGAVPLVPVPAGAGGVRGHLRAAGLHGRSCSWHLYRPAHGCPCALRGLRGEHGGLETGSGWGIGWESECLCFGFVFFSPACCFI